MNIKRTGIISFALLTITLASIGLIGDLVDGEEAVAAFSYSPDDIIVKEKVSFDASDSTGDDLDYEWHFGDGHEDDGVEVSHIYDRAGDFTVVLIVTNATGDVDTYTKIITVQEDPDGWWIGILFGVGFGLCLPAIMMVSVVVPFIFGVIWTIKMWQSAKEHDEMKTAQPYLIGMLVMGIITWFMGWMLFFLPLLGFFIVYRLYTKKMREIGIDIKRIEKKKRRKKR